MSIAFRTHLKRLFLAAASLLIAAAIWLPALHLFFRPQLSDFRQTDAIAPKARELANRHLHLWEDADAREKEISAMRANNAEWDFMGRTFFVLSLANMALDEPAQARRYLDVMDAIIAQTLALEREKGMYFFLMDYARAREFRGKPARSEFLDGEIAFMLGARLMVERKPEFEPLLAERVDALVKAMSRGPVMCGESYPDECWMFCNAVGAAAVRLSDRLDGRDHADFLHAWVAKIREKLVDKNTGILVSSFTYDGDVIDGPEGSSIWTVAHFLKMVDPEFAADQ